ncbi:MAG: AbrB/MazE/SpoVT family DNA-binding domain-containing protein [Candidatus Eremiobacteraeota bacterium]|nr:AbrB/MazE/SpoVT family DNA-binding domain-containing protein [Candidatus Eremiobacteraeota bacterium]MCW5869996.1 AbrB/MazE/SpoVT family DNA-binding domain-containing protein [Candidatus Eremiobacteraeota bacterium]
MSYLIELDESGRLALPAEVRRELGLNAGDRLVLEIRPDGLKLSSARARVEAARGIFKHIEPGKIWSDELIQERRRESALEQDGP